MNPKPRLLRQARLGGAVWLTALTGILISQWASLPVRGATPPELVLTEAENGKSVPVILFQSVAINLPGNPSTGYTWLLTSTNGNSVVSTGPGIYLPAGGGIPGGDATFHLPFQAIHPGATTLGFTYLQLWNPVGASQSYTVNLEVAPDPRPRLLIERTPLGIALRWPIANSAGFYLEGTTQMDTSHWAALNALPLREGQDFVVRLGLYPEKLYFRLRK